jgi:hypothetical protein
MSEKLMSILHMIPLLLIVALVSFSMVYQKITKNKLDLNLSAIALVLSSIGVASGFGIHHYAAEVAGACYFCFGYAAVLIAVACNIIKTTRLAKL